MRTVNILLLSLIFSNILSLEVKGKEIEKEVETVVSEVTVFREGAEITRDKIVKLSIGRTVLKFNNLSPFIDPKSIKVKTDDDVTIISIDHQDELSMDEISVTVETKIKVLAAIELTYLVENAGWHPSYDVRIKSINDPVEITYRANVKQETKADWNNVKLKFSSSSSDTSGSDILNNRSINSVSGQVFNEKGRPLSRALVSVPGTSIRTTTDANGKYSIVVPTNYEYLDYNFIGFKSLKREITSSVLNVKFLEMEQLDGSSYTPSNSSNLSLNQMVEQAADQTILYFDIETPYTIKSDDNTASVDMGIYQIPAHYQYYLVSNIDNDAFLVANITNWRELNLLRGGADIYFEETLIESSSIDVRFASDTLQISLGVDTSIKCDILENSTIEKSTDSGLKESRSSKITLLNSKDQEINLIILNESPSLSRSRDREIQIQEISGGERNRYGNIKWDFKLKPLEDREINLKYSVKQIRSKRSAPISIE